MSDLFATVQGVRLRYRLDGPEGAPPLALIHMGMANLTSYDPLMGRLAGAFRVLRFDTRGCGLSGGGPREAYRFPTYADDLAALMDAVGIAKAFVLGVAYGARTAGQFALRHPARLTRLGLFDVSFIPPVAKEAREAESAKAVALLREAGEPMPPVDPAWFQHQDRKEMGRAHTAHENEPDFTPQMAGVFVPTLIACGRQDLNLPQAERIAALMPAAELHVLEMTGHGSTLFRPALIADLIVDFARRHPA